jgi:hypothetical protein
VCLPLNQYPSFRTKQAFHSTPIQKYLLNIEDLNLLPWHVDLGDKDFTIFHLDGTIDLAARVEGGDHLEASAGNEGINAHETGDGDSTTGMDKESVLIIYKNYK